MKIVQIKVRSLKEALVTWVDYRDDLKTGKWITLKDFKPDQKWYVEEVYPGVHESSEFDWHRKWDNNI